MNNLTGRTHHRVQARLFRSPLLVLQVEVHQSGDGDCQPDLLWRDAQTEDFELLPNLAKFLDPDSQLAQAQLKPGIPRVFSDLMIGSWFRLRRGHVLYQKVGVRVGVPYGEERRLEIPFDCEIEEVSAPDQVIHTLFSELAVGEEFTIGADYPRSEGSGGTTVWIKTGEVSAAPRTGGERKEFFLTAIVVRFYHSKPAPNEFYFSELEIGAKFIVARMAGETLTNSSPVIRRKISKTEAEYYWNSDRVVYNPGGGSIVTRVSGQFRRGWDPGRIVQAEGAHVR